MVVNEQAPDVEEAFICDQEEHDESHEVTVTQATANLSTTIIGAGIMALPRAFATLGLGLGLGILATVFGLSYFSLATLVRCSTISGQRTYRGLAETAFGRAGSAAYVFAVLANNAGSMVVYLIIIGDVLIGVPPHYSGLLTNLAGVHDPSNHWWIDRPFVLGTLAVVVLAPLLSLRDLSLLAPFSKLAVVVAGAFATSIVVLAGSAAVEGRLGDYRWLPDPAVLGTDPTRRLVHVLSVLPIVTMCFVCHYNVLPLAGALQRFSERRMDMVIRRSLNLCSAVFAVVAVGGYALFGAGTSANILNNLTPEGLGGYLPAPAAAAISFGVRLGYCVCLIATFAMLNWTLRATLSSLIWRQGHPKGPARFFGLTYVTLALLYLTSITFPNVWQAMALTGSTAAVLIAFILPGALAARFHGPGEGFAHFAGWVCIIIGVTMGVVGVVNTLFLSA